MKISDWVNFGIGFILGNVIYYLVAYGIRRLNPAGPKTK